MFNPSTNWVEQIKYVVRDMINQKSFVLEGVVTSVDPAANMVKVMLEPTGIESGWLRCAVPYAGNGFGIVLPPPDEGTAVKVLFDMGDIKSGTVIGCVYNNSVIPPGSAGEIRIQHKSGSYISIGTDGLITIRGKNTTTTF